MNDFTLHAETGKYGYTVSPVEMLAFGDLKLDVTAPLFPHMATFMVAWSGVMATYDEERYANFMDNVAENFSGRIGARVDIAKSIRDVRAGALKREHTEESLCSMLAVVAVESCKATVQRLRAKHPVCEFLYHVRNAAAHGNKWHFYQGQPKHHAEWNNIVLKASMQDAKCFNGTLQPADLLFLVREVEKLMQPCRAGVLGSGRPALVAVALSQS